MTATVERVVLVTGGSASAATAANHVLFLVRVLDASPQAVPAIGTPQSSATETTETKTVEASASAALEAEEAAGAVMRRALLAGVRLTSEVVGGPVATAVVLDVDGDDEAWLAGYRAAGTVASRVARHAEAPTLVVPPSAGDGDTSGPHG